MLRRPGWPGPDGIVREWTVATFVVHRGRVLLLFHPKIGLWLPPGGHIEHGELPDEAAVREVLEETGVRCRLVGEHGVDVEYPRQLIRPFGIQVENIRPGVQHIDLVYFAVPDDDGWQLSLRRARRRTGPAGTRRRACGLGANDEIRAVGREGDAGPRTETSPAAWRSRLSVILQGCACAAHENRAPYFRFPLSGRGAPDDQRDPDSL